ncbi:MAG: hypothetical protein AB1497_03170 [Bacillota bacterium]
MEEERLARLDSADIEELKRKEQEFNEYRRSHGYEEVVLIAMKKKER